MKNIMLHDVLTGIRLEISKKPSKRLPNPYGTDDPDEMIKLHHKLINTFSKDSVHYRLFKKLKSRNKKQGPKEKEDIDYPGAEGECEGEGAERDDIEGVELSDYDQDDNDIVDQDANEVDNVTEFEENETIENNDSTSDIEELEDEVKKIDETEDDETTKEAFEKKMQYFKNMLNKKGYEFEQSEKVLLAKEEYIS